MLHPEIFRIRAAASLGIRPLYSLPSDVSQRLFAGMVEGALRRARASQLDAIPRRLRDCLDLPDALEALTFLHQPPHNSDPAALESGWTPAHQALVANELFTFQLAMALDRVRTKRRTSAVLNGADTLKAGLIAALPFALTSAQQGAIAEIESHLAAPPPMNRILIGDVGSGKTLVAFAAILRAVECGWQAAVMAPTELLAEQHFHNFAKICGPLGVISVLVTGRLTGAERARILRALGRGDIAVAFGTHALIQDGVRVARLGLAVIDEQHRFGVFDRARLLELGSQANVLLMTATPIPRSLAHTLFRNLDVSVLDEMPPGRTPVVTRIFDETDLPEVDRILRAELAQGHRAYYVLPLIEGDEDDQATVTAAAKRLTDSMIGFRVGLLHGRMRPADKELIMREFRDGEIDLLVSTTVIEVGVDVPEATAIVIIAAERFGLAQLHQLRGRVGRGVAASQCCLVVSSKVSAAARDRLEELARTASGNEVAALDLRTRGPGDLFGARQTGALPLRFASLIRDLSLVEHCAELAENWLRFDPDLCDAASGPLLRAIRELQSFGFSLGNIG
jgi:ATP-dependent DNA helicase RecG